MSKQNTFITPVTRPDLVERYLETLYEHNPDNFYVYLVDQTPEGIDMSLREKYKDLLIIRTPITDVHKRGNLGFAKANNVAIKLVETPYFTMANDDIEFLNRRWWDGAMETFAQVESQTPDRPAVIVNPSSTKLPDWSIGRPSGENHFVIDYKERYTEEEYTYLLENEHYINEHLTLKPNSVIDGITMYCSVAHTERFLQVGYLDEIYYPGGAEDYDFCCRASMRGFRCVGTTKSWVFHHWSKTLHDPEMIDMIRESQDDELRFGDQYKVWGERFDIWGIACPVCGLRMITTDNELAVCPEHPDQTFDIPPTITQTL